MTNMPDFNPGGRVIRPLPGKYPFNNEYEELVDIIEGTEIQGNCFVGRGTCLNNVTIYPHVRVGRYCSIARGAAVGAPNHPMGAVTTAIVFPAVNATLSFKTTEIGHDVWIGANATVLDGVQVGHGAIVGANAVVTRDVRPYDIVVGTPARQKRRRFSDEICEALLASHWWDLPHDVLIGLPMANVEETLRRIREIRLKPSEVHP